MKIAFLGAGKMAEALICRLGKRYRVTASDKDLGRLKQVRARYAVKITKSNLEAFNFGDVVVLAVKPQNFPELLSEVASRESCLPAGRSRVTSHKLIISIAAGMPLSYLQKKLPGRPIIRAMPNNPCLIGKGITALAKGKKVSSKQYAVADKIFRSVGEVVEIPEKWMDAVTGLSGSGPAFVYEVIEALTKGGVVSGLPKKVAAKLALQTVAGAAQTVKVTGFSPEELVSMVASPGGTTIEGLKVLEKFRFKHALKEAVVSAARKSKTLIRWR